MTTQVQNQKGFTLVEIAIVLVIIGLLLGGVLKGQELITNSKIKSVTADFDGIQAAYYAYQDRVGKVAGSVSGAAITDTQFWNDLRTQGFIKGDAVSGTASGPTHALDGSFVAYPGATVALTTAVGAMFAKNYICATNIDPIAAGGMDTKMDNGVHTSGIVKATADYTGTTAITVCREL